MKRKHSDDPEGSGRASKKNKKEKRAKHKKHKHKKKRTRSPTPRDEAIGPHPCVPSVKEKNDVAYQAVNKDSRAFQPMTKEQWEKEQNKITRVYDEETGRHRLVRGSGEIIEEIVSRERQKEINKRTTTMDGVYYQNHVQKLFKN